MEKAINASTILEHLFPIIRSSIHDSTSSADLYTTRLFRTTTSSMTKLTILHFSAQRPGYIDDGVDPVRAYDGSSMRYGASMLRTEGVP